jgi:hypothetical protein
MDDRRRDFSIASHVEAISARTDAERDLLSAALVGRSWPGGPVDRTERAALAWLRRWRPGRPGLKPLACECAAGRCLVCN